MCVSAIRNSKFLGKHSDEACPNAICNKWQVHFIRIKDRTSSFNLAYTPLLTFIITEALSVHWQHYSSGLIFYTRAISLIHELFFLRRFFNGTSHDDLKTNFSYHHYNKLKMRKLQAFSALEYH